MHNGNFFQRFLKKVLKKLEWKYLSKVFEKVFFLENTIEISSQGFEKVFKNDAQTGSHRACQFV